MTVKRPELDRTQMRQLARFERMGLAVRPMPDGRSLLVSLPLTPKPLDSVSTSILPRRAVFATVGAHQIKCLRPRAFFGLPLIDIRHCASAASIEATLRQAWRDRTLELLQTRARLRELGIDAQTIGEQSALAFPLPGESTDGKIIMQRLGEAILPSAGPLSGIPLHHPHERILEVSDCLDSGSDLECRLAERMETQRGEAVRARERHRTPEGSASPSTLGPMPKAKNPARSLQQKPKVLIVGSHLVDDESLLEEFRRQGYRLHVSRSETDALGQLGSMSPDVIVSEYVLGRSDGASLVQGISELPGIERIPVVLLDEIGNDSRREIARAVGAVGYLTDKLDPNRFVTRLRRVVQEPAGRRFTRYRHQVVARLEGTVESCLITELGRGGVFIATPQILDSHTAMRCKMALPELGQALTFEGEVRYCTEMQGTTRQGIGLRFYDMSSTDEENLIHYLGLLESRG